MKNDSNDDTPTSRIIIALEMLTNDRVLKFYTSNTEKEGGGLLPYMYCKTQREFVYFVHIVWYEERKVTKALCLYVYIHTTTCTHTVHTVHTVHTNIYYYTFFSSLSLLLLQHHLTSSIINSPSKKAIQ